MLQQDNKSKEDIGNVLRAITIKKTLVHIIQEWNIPGNKEISYVTLTEGYGPSSGSLNQDTEALYNNCQ